MGAKHPRMGAEMDYFKKNNIYKAIHHKMRKNDMYETYMHKIYNIIVGQTNEKLQEKAEFDATFHAFKTGRDHIGYLVILKKL